MDGLSKFVDHAKFELLQVGMAFKLNNCSLSTSADIFSNFIIDIFDFRSEYKKIYFWPFYSVNKKFQHFFLLKNNIGGRFRLKIKCSFIKYSNRCSPRTEETCQINLISFLILQTVWIRIRYQLNKKNVSAFEWNWIKWKRKLFERTFGSPWFWCTSGFSGRVLSFSH